MGAAQLRKNLYALRARAFRAAGRLTAHGDGRRFIIPDPSLIGYHGHHAEFARLLKAELGRSSRVTFYANFKAKTPLLLELMAQPVFWDSDYVTSGNFPALYPALRDSIAESFGRIPEASVDPAAWIVMHTATIYQLGGLARWYAGLAPDRRPRVFIQFQFPLEFQIDEGYWDEAMGKAREATEAIASLGTLQLSANSRALAERIGQQLGQACALMPLPIRWPAMLSESAPFSAPSFGFFGGLRNEKGASLLAAAIPRFAARYPDTRFIVHAPEWESDKAAIDVLRRVPSVELLSQNFRAKEDYFAALRRSACILLAYSPAAYALRTSGIFLEAIGLGQLVVTTAGSWMASELEQRPDVTGYIMAAFTVDALLDALERARRGMSEQPFIARPRLRIIEQNSPAAFCTALERLTGRDGR